VLELSGIRRGGAEAMSVSMPVKTEGTVIKRIGAVPVFVSDQDRALSFYRDKLGFEVISDVPIGDGFRWLLVTPQEGGTEIILFCPTNDVNRTSKEDLQKRIGIWTGIVLLTDDIKQSYRLMSERGVEFESEPLLQPWKVWETRFSDPDGNRLHLVQRLEHTFS
jgi:catechol 2,3-dioxygenase-like lactoylglutathione lyase family enzyme